MSLPLEGVRIVDLSRLLPGAWCSMILSDFGAEVIKVEAPGIGDYSRWAPPFYGGESIYFLNLNRNKKSIILDLKTQEGKEVFFKLVERADILLESFRPGAARRLGIHYERLAEINPRLIYCSITGYGQYGPYKDHAGHDMNIIGVAGAVAWPRDGDGTPTRATASVGDMAGGDMAAIGILVALAAREKTGRGQLVDISMLDGIVSWYGATIRDYFAKLYGQNPDHPTTGSPRNTIYKCKDGKFVTFVAMEKKFWVNFCRKVGREDMIDDNEMVEDRLTGGKRRDEIAVFLKELFLTKTRNEWVEFLKDIDVPCYPVNSLEEVFQDPHVLARGMVTEIEHPKLGRIKQIGNPIKLSQTPGSMKLPPPSYGQHTEEILRSLGYTDGDIERLRQGKVITEIGERDGGYRRRS